MIIFEEIIVSVTQEPEIKLTEVIVEELVTKSVW